MKKSLLPLLFFIVSYTNAQWTSDTTMNTIVRDTAGAMSQLTASRPDGSTYICWYEYGGSNLDLHMQLLDSNGYMLWAPEGIVVSNFPQNSATYTYDLKVDNEGNAIVAFQDERSGTLQIVAYKIGASGNFIWGNSGLSLIDSTSLQGIAPSIAITSNEDVYIAWNAEDTAISWIACQRISSAGVIQWSNPYRQKDSTASLDFSNPRLIPIGSEKILILFIQRAGGFYGNYFVQNIDASGSNIWPSAKQVSTKSVASYFAPVTVADNTGFFLVFDTSNPVSLSMVDVYVQHIDSAGNLWSTTGIEAANSITEHKSTADGCISYSGEFWVLMKVLDNSQNNAGVSVQKFDSAGNVLLGPNGLNIIPIDPIYYEPNTINDAANGMILTTTYGGFNAQRMIAMKLDYAGATVWANPVVSLCAVSSGKDEVQSGEFINNNLVIVWQDNRNSSGIFAQNINGDGGLGIITGVDNLTTDNISKFYPNPSSAPQIFFSNSSKTNYAISIFDIQGKELASFEIPETVKSVSLNDYSNLSQGIYFLTVKNSNCKEIFRWIKN